MTSSLILTRNVCMSVFLDAGTGRETGSQVKLRTPFFQWNNQGAIMRTWVGELFSDDL